MNPKAYQIKLMEISRAADIRINLIYYMYMEHYFSIARFPMFLALRKIVSSFQEVDEIKENI